MLEKPLSSRQMQVLELLIERKSNSEIAAALGLSSGHVLVYKAIILRHLPDGSITSQLLQELRSQSLQLSESAAANPSSEP